MDQGTGTRAGGKDRFLFLACFAALVATSFAFIIRVMVMDDWQVMFNLSETQKGQIFGAGLWPFGVSIVLFSLVIDRIGYGPSMIFAFGCHVLSSILLVTAGGYNALYLGSVLNGLAAGTVEAVINPAVASMYPRQKTRMLSILHAGWPGGFVLGGLLLFGLQGLGVSSWQVKVAIILLPTIVYGAMLLRCRFPVSERVAAGVKYREMLAEPGAIGCLIVVYMIAMELSNAFGLDKMYESAFLNLPAVPFSIAALVLTAVYFVYTRSLGRPMYILLLLVMILLATTELGTDTWIKDLMKPAMKGLGVDSGWVLVYTATIMMILRFCIGPIERALRPLGVLLVSSLFAAVGLYFLSHSEGVMILVMATIYGAGQCFFWPVTLGLVAEQFPKGGALTLNAIAGVGMLGVGILGAQLLGFWQDTQIDAKLQERPLVYERLMASEPKQSIFGEYKARDMAKVNAVNDKVKLFDYRASATHPDPAELVNDNMYRMLVRNAYDHSLRTTNTPDVVSHEDMHAALEEAGMFVSDAEIAPVRADKEIHDEVLANAQQTAMSQVAILPLIMAACYLGLIFYFQARGGYRPVDLTADGGDSAA